MHIKKQGNYFGNKGLYSLSYDFSSNHAWLWELDHKEGWAQKNWWFWIVLEKTLESHLESKEIKPVYPKGNQPWIFIGKSETEAEAPIPCHLMQRANPLEKIDAGKNWGQKEKGATEDEMVEEHHWLNGREFEPNFRDSEGQGSLACSNPWGHKQLDTTEQLNNNNQSLVISEQP